MWGKRREQCVAVSGTVAWNFSGVHLQNWSRNKQLVGVSVDWLFERRMYINICLSCFSCLLTILQRIRLLQSFFLFLSNHSWKWQDVLPSSLILYYLRSLDRVLATEVWQKSSSVSYRITEDIISATLHIAPETAPSCLAQFLLPKTHPKNHLW